MNWIAVVPLRQGSQPKSRLSCRLSPEQRVVLTMKMARIVIDALQTCEAIEQIVVLSPHPPADGLSASWRYDSGRGMNAELDALREDLHDAAMLVILGDLPLVGPEDIEAMLAAAEQNGVALAPDRHDEGTNAVAIAQGRAFNFAFGEGSLSRHKERTEGAMVVQRRGLSLDIDTPEDLDAAIEAGYRPQLG